MDIFWNTLGFVTQFLEADTVFYTQRSKGDQIEDQEIDDRDNMNDADLLVDEDLVDIVASAGAGTSSG